MTSTLSISGDLGSAVLSWNTTGNTLDNIVDYSKSLSYFVGKMETSDDKYEYDSDALEKELSDYLGLNDEEEYSLSLEDRQEMKQDLIECFDEFTGEYDLDSDLRDKLTDFDPDWWEGIPDGRQISDRARLWALGLQQAMAQIKQHEKNNVRTFADTQLADMYSMICDLSVSAELYKTKTEKAFQAVRALNVAINDVDDNFERLNEIVNDDQNKGID
ncbi:hypothetical protein [uncultured Limosilactobacillus sp.]|nr:hypothetical protein [uncultured Limosilactobacillus sp.]